MVSPLFYQETTTADGELPRLPVEGEPLPTAAEGGSASLPATVINTTHAGLMELIGLSSSTRYAAQVSAWTQVGEGPWSPAKTYTTLTPTSEHKNLSFQQIGHTDTDTHNSH